MEQGCCCDVYHQLISIAFDRLPGFLECVSLTGINGKVLNYAPKQRKIPAS